MKEHGGKREGAGRKSKAAEVGSQQLAINAIVKKHGSLENGLQSLLDSGETALIKFVYEHAIGRPTETLDVNMPEGINIVFKKA